MPVNEVIFVALLISVFGIAISIIEGIPTILIKCKA